MDTADTSEVETDPAPTCDPEPLPKIPPEQVMLVRAFYFDPAMLCWENMDVEVDRTYWYVFEGECPDMSYTLSRIDCSCLQVTRYCIPAGDPSVGSGSMDGDWCGAAEEMYGVCP